LVGQDCIVEDVLNGSRTPVPSWHFETDLQMCPLRQKLVVGRTQAPDPATVTQLLCRTIL